MIKRVSLFSFFSELTLIFLIIFAPLNYGSLTPLGQTILQLSSLSFFFILLIRLAVASNHKVVYPSAIVFMIFFFAMILFQLIPLSQNTIKALSPQTLQLYKQYLPSLKENSRYTLSIYPFATKKELIQFFAVFVLFLVTVNVVDNKRKFERILAAIILWAAGLALYGIMKKFFIAGGWDHTDFSFSTFSHRNAYAGYMAMIAPLSIGYAFSCRDIYKRMFFGFLAAIISVSIFISLSRGGSISLIFSLIIFLILSSRKVSARKNIWMAIIFIVAITILLMIVSLQLEPLKKKLLDLFGQSGLITRWVIVKDSSPIIKSFSLFGVGLGNTPHIFTKYKTFQDLLYYTHLHNDHLQLLIEVGFIASIFCLLFFIIVFKDILITFRKAQDPFVVNIVAGGISGIFGIILHAFVDGVFHIPASLFMFWLILGLIYKCAHTNFSYEGDRT